MRLSVNQNDKHKTISLDNIKEIGGIMGNY